MKRWYTIFDKTSGVILRRVRCAPDLIALQYDAATHAHVEGNFDDTAFRIDPETLEPLF